MLYIIQGEKIGLENDITHHNLKNFINITGRYKTSKNSIP